MHRTDERLDALADRLDEKSPSPHNEPQKLQLVVG